MIFQKRCSMWKMTNGEFLTKSCFLCSLFRIPSLGGDSSRIRICLESFQGHPRLPQCHTVSIFPQERKPLKKFKSSVIWGQKSANFLLGQGHTHERKAEKASFGRRKAKEEGLLLLLFDVVALVWLGKGSWKTKGKQLNTHSSRDWRYTHIKRLCNCKCFMFS